MSSIGATEGKEPDHISDEDIQALTLDDMRGAYQDMHAAKLSLNERGTVAGLSTEVEVAKQQMEMLHEQMRRLIGMYTTLNNEFKQYREQRVKELNVRVNGGSTSPEDTDDGAVIKSGN
jgi:hypothetical protein